MSRDRDSRIFNLVAYLILTAVGLLALYPLVYVALMSFADSSSISNLTTNLIPEKWTLSNYQYLLVSRAFPRSFIISTGLMVVGTTINLALTSLTGYALARRGLPGQKIFLSMVIFTLLFNGGMIPSFLVVKGLGLYGSWWALILPGAISSFNLIVMRNFFLSLPLELDEAARIDGANDWTIFRRIVLPLSTPSLAAFSIFYAVGHWNSYFSAILYLTDATKWPLQVVLRQLILMGMGTGEANRELDAFLTTNIAPASIRMAAIVVTIIPMLIIYPIGQRYFTKGLTLGSIKG